MFRLVALDGTDAARAAFVFVVAGEWARQIGWQMWCIQLMEGRLGAAVPTTGHVASPG